MNDEAMNEEPDATSAGGETERRPRKFGIPAIMAAIDAKKQQAARNKIEKEELWNRMGFHRIAGSYLYGYVLALGEALLGIILIGVILPTFLPYPEITGYKNMAGAFVGFWYGLFDLNLGGGGGFSDGMMRFIGQYSSNEPRRALKYIQFYIWWQMMTGLIQVTVFATIAFFYLVHTSLAYLTWFIFADMMVQYPGMLMVMSACLKSFQRGDKLGILVWLQNTVFQVTTNIVCLIIGKYWGDSDPAVGELMGISIFYILSMYLDDWLNLLLGGHFFNQVLKERGVTDGIRAIFKPEFDRKVVKECMTFTGKQWIGNQLLGLFGYFVGLWILINMPSFGSWSGLMMIPAFLGHLVSHPGSLMGLVSPAISESYNNKKKELTQHVICSALKLYVIVTGFMVTGLIVISPLVMNTVIRAFPALKNYQLGIVMIPIVLVVEMTSPFRGLWGTIFVACNRPMPPIVLNFVFTLPGYAIKFLFIWLCLYANIFPVWYLLMVPDFITSMLQAIVGFAWIQKSVIQIRYRKMFVQGVLAPMLACICFAGVLLLFSYTAWPALEYLFSLAFGTEIGLIVMAILMLLSLIFIFPGIFYCPFLGLMGAWDDYTLEELRKAVELSGPSKIAMHWMFRITKIFTLKCRWRNHNPISNYDAIELEMHELVKKT